MSKRRLAKGRSRYFSDLDDREWSAVRAAAFPDQPDPSGLRPVVGALLYQDRSLCPWDLLPPGLPPADVLRPQLDQWQADGTWDLIRDLADAWDESDGEAPLWPALSRARRAVARAARQLPGADFLLAPGRAVIRAIDYVRGRIQPAARLPGMFRRAYRLMRQARYAEAAGVYARILEIDPLNKPSRLELAAAYVEAGRFPEVIPECHRALSCPNLEVGDVIRANHYLARAHAQTGDRERAVRHWHQARLVSLYGKRVPRSPEDGRDDPDWYEQLAESYNEVAEYLINARGDFPGAVELYRRREGVCAAYTRWLAAAPGRTLLLPPDWVRSIGHIALLDIWVKLHQLGWLDRDRLSVVAPTRGTANPVLLDYFRPHVRVKAAPDVGRASAHLASALGPRVANAIDLPDGTTEYFCNAMGLIQEAWEAEGRGSLLTLTAADRAFGEAELRKLGVPPGAWFVALHVRSPGYYGEFHTEHQAHRNADIRDYLPAVREITRRGGWVVRLGDASMEPLPPTPGAVDYATSPVKSARMDVFLCGAARFYVGVASGLCQVPPAFGVPVVTTNWMSNQPLATYYRTDLCIPKLLFSEPHGRVLTFRERFTDPVIGWCHTNDELRKNGLRGVPNTPAEIRDVVAEMLDRLDGTDRETDADRELFARFEETLRDAGVRKVARIGRGFLRAHAHLMTARTRVAA